MNSNSRYVAIKVSVSEPGNKHEVKVLQAISALPTQHPGQAYVTQILDHFTIVGPNGAHGCLVLDLMGPSVPDFIESPYRDERLPAATAKGTARQILQGVDFLAQNRIGHGGESSMTQLSFLFSPFTDLHTRNVVFTIPNVDDLTEQQFFKRFGKPETAPVIRTDSTALAENIPPYIVRPGSLLVEIC